MKGPEVLKHQDFKLLWLGQAISQFGDAMYFLLVPFMVKRLTGEDSQVGIAIACQGIPFLLFSVWAGALADRMDRRSLMLFSDFGSAAALVAACIFFAFLPNPPVALLYGLAFSLAFLQVFFMPAKSAAIPRLVPTQDLLAANALSATTQQLMPLIGLAVSAIALAPFSGSSPKEFFMAGAMINAASFVVSGLYILRLPRIKADRDHEELKHPLSDAAEGLRYVMQRHTLWILVLLSFGLNLIVSPFMVVYTSVNNSWFGGKYESFAWLEVGFMFGLLLGAISSPMIKAKHPAALMSWMLTGVGALILALAVARDYAFFWTLNFLAGVLLPIGNIPMQTYVQRVVEDKFMGRVQSVFTMASLAIMPVGAFFGGLLIGKTSAETMFVVMGAGMIVISIIPLFSARFRKEEMPPLPESSELGEVACAVPGSTSKEMRPGEDDESGDATNRESTVA